MERYRRSARRADTRMLADVRPNLRSTATGLLCCVCPHPGSCDFYSPEEVKAVYYPEVERLLRDTLGASRVVRVQSRGPQCGHTRWPRTVAPRAQRPHGKLSAPARARSLGLRCQRAAEAPLRRCQCLAANPRAGSRLPPGAVRCAHLHATLTLSPATWSIRM